MRRIAFPLLGLAVLLGPPHAAQAQDRVRLVDDVTVFEQKGYVAVNVVFGCTLRYVSHDPAETGTTVHVRLNAGPDCGTSVGDVIQPLTAGLQGTIRSIDVQRPFGTNVDLRITWSRAEQVAVVPSFNGQGLRIRLLRPEPDQGQVSVQEVPGGAATYAVNLDSSREPIGPEAIAAAARDTGVRAYVSEVVVDGERWYRLRAGPFVTEADAKRVLASARTQYPKAWMAIADDEVMNAVGVPAAVGNVPATVSASATTLTPTDRDRLLVQARQAFRKKDYATAIPLLTKLVEQPEFPQRAEAQELLALSRERSGQLAHAKAEYEEYLRRYPQGDGADRVRKRLAAIALASRPSHAGGAGGAGDESPWRVYGGFSQIYRRDTTSVDSGIVSVDLTTQNALLNDVALMARRHGERFDFATRVSGGYTLDMLSDGPGDQTRVSTAYAELTDRAFDWTVRAGRQSGSAGGVFGTFDGVYGSYQVREGVRLGAYFGFPVESTRKAPDTDRRFYGVAADLGTFANAWDFTVYAISQEYYGVTDRQAVGSEIRYFRPGLTFLSLLDYDFHYDVLNDALLIGTIGLPARWTLNATADLRKTPSLTTRNAMIGQPVRTFDELFGLFPRDELEQLARDRTADAETYSLSLSRPFGERWQWSIDASTMEIGATRASGGVEATPASGPLLAVSSQVLAYGLFGRGDVASLGVQYQDGDTVTMVSAGLYSQFPIGEHWRLGPRLRVDRREFATDGSTQLTWTPSLRAEVRSRHLTLEFEGGAEIGSRDLGKASEDTSRYYVSLGYRYDF